MKPIFKELARPLCIIALLVLGFLAATGTVNSWLSSAGLDSMNTTNDEYLEKSFDKSLNGFLVLSAIKSGVAVLEGSSIGIGFNLEVGDIVQSIYDFVDVAWRTSLAGCSILLLIRLMLQTVQTINHWFLSASLLLSALLLTCRLFLPRKPRIIRRLKEILLFSASLTVALYLIMPLSITSARFLSKKITRPLVEEAEEGFESAKADFTPESLNKRFFPEDAEKDDSFWSRFDFKAKLQGSKQALISMGAWLKGITRDFAVWTIKLVAGYIFDCIVFPLAFFVVVFLATRGLLAYCLGIDRQSSVCEDFEAIVKKYYDRGKKEQPEKHVK